MIKPTNHDVTYAESKPSKGTTEKIDLSKCYRASSPRTRSTCRKPESQPIRTDRIDWERSHSIGGSNTHQEIIDELIKETVDQLACAKNYVKTLEAKLNHLKSLKDATNQDEAFGLDVTTEIPNDKD
jgi:hypothetical protein